MLLFPDKFASVFKDEELVCCDKSRYSLGVAILDPAPREFLDFYRAFLSRLNRALPERHLRGMYLYPPAALHCTCATLHGYSRPPPQDDGKRLRAMWARGVDGLAEALPPFRLLLSGAVMDGSAAYFTFDDMDGGIKRIRSYLTGCADAPDMQLQTAQSHSSLDYFRTSTIVHVSFMRFRSVSSQARDQSSLLTTFDNAVRDALVEPVQVQIPRVTLRESRSLHAIARDCVYCANFRGREQSDKA
jgi:hypothetical protein